MSILDISKKRLCINFSMTTLNQSMGIEQNYVMQILIALLLILQDISNDVEKWFDTSNYNKKLKYLLR